MTTLDEIQARADAATEGPWEARSSDSGSGKKVLGPRKANDIITGLIVLMQPIFWDERSARNAEFIAAAREDVPKLVAALRSIEDLLTYWDTLADGDRYYAATVRARIREALG